MLGLFGKKKEPETLLKKEKDRYGGSGFDPTGLERAAKAAREIDASAHARLAFDVIQAREATKRLEHGTRQAAYEMRAREYEMQSVGKEGAEARQTLALATLREVALLKELVHDNIVRLRDVVAAPPKLYLVFDYHEQDLKQCMDKHFRDGMPATLIKTCIMQILRGAPRRIAAAPQPHRSRSASPTGSGTDQELLA